MNKKTWVVVASRPEAKIYEFNRGDGSFALVETLEDPRGRLQGREINSDKSGQTHSSAGYAHSLDPEESTAEHQLEEFAKTLATLLERHSVNHNYEQLVLVAEPRFMGRLKGELGTNTRGKVTESIEKDLAQLPEAELAKRLSALL